ncbi:hypothetical protein KKG05_00580, partial [bacterium]|nr:hypothetical protein [bacterium]
MCVIAGSERVEVLWIQEACLIDSQKNINTVYTTVAFSNSDEDSGPLFFLLPNAISKAQENDLSPKDLTSTILDKTYWISLLWEEVAKHLGIRQLNIYESHFDLAFFGDTNRGRLPRYGIRVQEDRTKFELWPNDSYLGRINEVN